MAMTPSCLRTLVNPPNAKVKIVCAGGTRKDGKKRVCPARAVRNLATKLPNALECGPIAQLRARRSPLVTHRWPQLQYSDIRAGSEKGVRPGASIVAVPLTAQNDHDASSCWLLLAAAN